MVGASAPMSHGRSSHQPVRLTWCRPHPDFRSGASFPQLLAVQRRGSATNARLGVSVVLAGAQLRRHVVRAGEAPALGLEPGRHPRTTPARRAAGPARVATRAQRTTRLPARPPRSHAAAQVRPSRGDRRRTTTQPLDPGQRTSSEAATIAAASDPGARRWRSSGYTGIDTGIGPARRRNPLALAPRGLALTKQRGKPPCTRRCVTTPIRLTTVQPKAASPNTRAPKHIS